MVHLRRTKTTGKLLWTYSRSKNAVRSGLAHDLEHACAALGARALHGTTPVGHNVLFRIFHHPFCFALYAIAFYFSCHILWSFEVSYVMQGNWIAGLLSYWFSTRVSG